MPRVRTVYNWRAISPYKDCRTAKQIILPAVFSFNQLRLLGVYEYDDAILLLSNLYNHFQLGVYAYRVSLYKPITHHSHMWAIIRAGNEQKQPRFLYWDDFSTVTHGKSLSINFSANHCTLFVDQVSFFRHLIDCSFAGFRKKWAIFDKLQRV